MNDYPREMLLHGQLQEGLIYSLMESPAVLGTQNYKELSLAVIAKWEDRRLNELKKKQQYLMKTKKPQTSSHPKKQLSASWSWFRKPGDKSKKRGFNKGYRCYVFQGLFTKWPTLLPTPVQNYCSIVSGRYCMNPWSITVRLGTNLLDEGCL